MRQLQSDPRLSFHWERTGRTAGRVRHPAFNFIGGVQLAASPLHVLQTGSAVIDLYDIQVAVGRLMAEFGLVNEQYRNPESN